MKGSYIRVADSGNGIAISLATLSFTIDTDTSWANIFYKFSFSFFLIGDRGLACQVQLLLPVCDCAVIYFYYNNISILFLLISVFFRFA